MRDTRERAMWWNNPRYAALGAAATGVVALGLCLYQLKQPGVLRGVTAYDDGVYLGIIARFVHGAMPYRDFAAPNPPGLTVLLSPIALAGSFSGTRTLMAVCRVLTAIVTAANAVLAGRLLRFRGVVPALVAGGALAVFPMAATADKTLLLEPYLVLFSLLGMTAMFDGDELTDSRRRLAVAGGAFGFAIAVKLFAVIPAVVAVACARRCRSRMRAILIGIAAGAVLPSLPFLLIAPGNFLRDSVILQLLRHSSPRPPSVADRVVSLTGIAGIPLLHASAHVAYGFAAAFVALVIVTFSVGARSTLDRFVLASATLTVAAFLYAADFFDHYTYFSAAFLALLLGISCDRLARMIRRRATGRAWTNRVRSWAAATAVAITVVTIAMVAQQVTRFERQLNFLAWDRGPLIAAAIPKGACTVTDDASLTIAVNRFVADRPGCPKVVDSFWVWHVYDRKTVPPSAGPYDRALVAAWRSWLNRADYAVFSGPSPGRIPWPPDLRAWFAAHYTRVSSSGAFVYRFTGAR